MHMVSSACKSFGVQWGTLGYDESITKISLLVIYLFTWYINICFGNKKGHWGVGYGGQIASNGCGYPTN